MVVAPKFDRIEVVEIKRVTKWNKTQQELKRIMAED
jgi:hypothetical protein